MTPVTPYRVQRDQSGHNARLLLRLQDCERCLVLIVNMEQARSIAAEMHGLATNHCSHHHMLSAMVAAFNATVTSVILREIGKGLVTGSLRLECGDRVIEVDTDVAAALGLAIHLGIPMFVSGEHVLSEDRLKADQCQAAPLTATEIPAAFREVIEGLDMPMDRTEEDDRGMAA